jgi:hypothetical protein
LLCEIADLVVVPVTAFILSKKKSEHIIYLIPNPPNFTICMDQELGRNIGLNHARVHDKILHNFHVSSMATVPNHFYLFDVDIRWA